MDERIKKLAKVLVNFSTKVGKGDKVLIEVTDCGPDIGRALIKEVYAAGGIPHFVENSALIRRELLLGGTREQIEAMARYDSARMQDMQCYIAIRGVDNTSETSDVPADRMELWQSIYVRQVHTDLRVKKTRWVVTRFPNASMAQHAGMSTEAFTDFYYDVCTMDYSKMGKAMEALKARMDKADEVHIVGEGTDLRFSIKDIPTIICSGNMNIPDGEIYTAPVRDSMNGVITYNTPSFYQGFKYENIRFEIKDGKIVKAAANDNTRIDKLLDTDEGARYFGEFAIGINPFILDPMLDTLFDEKIAGSIHLTPGSCYEDADNGNNSAIHWDLVYIQRPEYGGGKIFFDGELIRENGRFVPEDLQCLNEENLK